MDSDGGGSETDVPLDGDAVFVLPINAMSMSAIVTPFGLSCYHALSCTYILLSCVPLDHSYQTMTSFIGLTCYLDT